MAGEADDALDLEDEMIVDEEQEEQHEAEEQLGGEDDGEEIPVFGDDEPPAEAPPETDLIKHLRRRNRELEEEAKRHRRQPEAEQPIIVGDRPTMEACDYDQDAFDRAFDAWENRREQKRQQDARIAKAGEDQQTAFNKVVEGYQTSKAALKFADKDAAEAVALEALSGAQQAVIAKVAPNPGLFIYAAGKNPARLNALAAINDPLELAAAVGRMGATLQMKKTGRAPDPDTPVRGATVRSGTVDKQLEKLEREADRTGDRTALRKYRQQQRANA